MSHTEAFGHLRSFVVGLEEKARDLRKVLESSRDEDGKWVNGKDGTGVGERCARAVGAASPQHVTKVMISEVAEQDKLLRQVEEAVATDGTTQEDTEKYEALVEYNQLALEDLEERLAAYGYVQPERVTLDNKAAVDPPAASSVARPPAPTRIGTESTPPPTCDRRLPGAGDGDGCGGDGRDGIEPGVAPAATPSGDTPFSGQQQQQQQQQQHGEDENPDYHDKKSAMTAWAHGVCEGEASADKLETEVLLVGDSNPTHPSLVVDDEEPQEEAPGSPPTPTSPGLADWEITEETREMLRQAQPLRPCQRSGSRVDAAAPRSLEALLAANTATRAVAARGGSFAPSDRRASVASDWSPPPSPCSSSTGARQASSEGAVEIGGGVPTKDFYTAGVAGVASSGAVLRSTATGTRVEVSTWRSDADSNPPTPARMGFESEGSWTPGGAIPAEAAPDGGDSRKSSLGSPTLSSRSPLKSHRVACLVEAALSSGKKLCISTPSEKGSPRSDVWQTTASPIRRVSTEGDEAPLEDSLRKGPRGDFWGSASPASSVGSPSRGTTGEQIAATSPETPPSPQMLSPRFRIDGDFDADGAAATADPSCSPRCPPPSPFRATQSSATKMALTPNDAPRHGSASENGDEHSCTPGGANRGEYESDTCPTLELSSPLRSRGVSSRDLEVLTPSIIRSRENVGCSGSGSNEGSIGGNDRSIGGGSCGGEDSDTCLTPELSSPLRSAGSAALCRRRLEQAEGEDDGHHEDEKLPEGGGPLKFVSEEEYSKAPKFLTIQVSRSVLNDTIRNLNVFAAPRLGSPSELLLTVNEIMDIIDQGELSRTLLLSAAHLKRVEMKGPRMYRIRIEGI